jgi:AraC family transcriptional regulator of arabinose operon
MAGYPLPGGGGELSLRDGSCLKIEAGDVVCVPSESVRRYWCVEARWNFWWFECEVLGRDLVQTTRSVPTLPFEAVMREEIWRNLKHPHPERNQLASSAFAYLLHHWLVFQPGPGGIEERITEIIAEIPLRCGRPWSVRDMARQAGMSERSFRMHFRIVSGQTPLEYRNAVRLRIAAEQLKTTGHQVQEIAEELGFSSPFHFSKAFRNRYGASPREFRLGKQIL